MREESPSRPIRTPHDAELAACEWMRFLGFKDAELTGAGTDGGVDVRSSHAIAQVKKELVPTGRPKLQELFGIAAHEKKHALFFTIAGYTEQALTWGTEVGMALFQFDYAGEAVPQNRAASSLMERAGPMSVIDAVLLVLNEETATRSAVVDKIRSAYVRVMEEGEPEQASKAAINLAEFLTRLDDHAGALSAISWIFQNGSDHDKAAAQFEYGWVLERSGQIDQAQETYRQVMASGASDEFVTNAAFRLGFTMEEQGNVAAALAAYRIAIATGGPEWASRAADHLARLSGDQDDLATARAALEKTVRHGDPDTGHEALLDLGRLLARQGDLADAEALYRRALAQGSLQQEHRDETALYLMDLLAGQGKFDELRSLYRSLHGPSAIVPPALLERKAVLHELGKRP